VGCFFFLREEIVVREGKEKEGDKRVRERKRGREREMNSGRERCHSKEISKCNCKV
jgi:hypothetical protein